MDSGFKSRPFPAYTLTELRNMVAAGAASAAVVAEVARREKAIAGDVSVMSDGERLRFARTGKAL